MSNARGANRYVVARADSVSEGGRIIVDVAGISIGIFRHDGAFYAVLNRCPHQGAELCKGTMVGLLEADVPGEIRFDGGHKLLECPWHGWEFDLATGKSYFDPVRTRVRRYDVSVEHGDAVARDLDAGGSTQLVEGPYTLERFPVSVEADYLVVTLQR